MSKSNYITPTGEKKLRDELNHLWKVERPKVTRQVSDAAAMGDRSENAEYIYGKRRLREIDRRVGFLKRRLDILKVVVPQNHTDGKIYFGAKVTVESEDGTVSNYHLVGPDECDVAEHKISIDSPIGKALLGKKIDDEISVNTPSGEKHFVVLVVAYK